IFCSLLILFPCLSYWEHTNLAQSGARQEGGTAEGAALLRFPTGQGGLSVIVFVSLWKEAHMEDPVPVKEEYTYQVGKIQFIVTPVYKDKGESMRDILLKLMLADLEPA
ncbi:hypothetical protein LIP85_10530, partial [Flavonifractor plautii]